MAVRYAGLSLDYSLQLVQASIPDDSGTLACHIENNGSSVTTRLIEAPCCLQPVPSILVAVYVLALVLPLHQEVWHD
jgi:hypothetical protein